MMKTKKYIGLTLAAALLLAACSKAEPEDSFGGYTEPSDYVKQYMINFADKLVTQNLSELEDALAPDALSGISRFFYSTGGRALTEDGAVWTVVKEGDTYGLTMTKLSGASAWELSNETALFFDGGGSFRTDFRLTATAADASLARHRSWNVTFSGQRHEEDGFWCEFHSEDPIEYRALSEDGYWNAYGCLLMTVYDGSRQVDKVVMELRGARSATIIAHIL